MYSPISLTGAGTAPVVNLTFPFLDRSHVKATVNGVAAAFSWTGASQITFSAVAAGGSAVLVYRETPISSPLVDFEDTSVLTAADLDLADTQLRYHQEEADVRITAGAVSGGSLSFASRGLMAGAETANNLVAFLTEAGREGTFIFRDGNYSAEVASDTLQGLFVAPGAAPTGASGAWVRVWDGINGKPEWFGAVINDAGADNRAALTACTTLCPVTKLKSADYYISGRFNLERGYRAFEGPFNPDGYDAGHGTRLISTNTAFDVMRVGPASAPASTDDFLRNVTIRGITFMHVGTRTLPAAGLEKSAVAGLRAEYLIDSTISDNYANEPLVGFVYFGVIGSAIDRNRAFRSALFGGNDVFIGHLLWGNPMGFGVIGNNASYFAERWNATTAGAALGLPSANRVGMWFDGAFADGFIDHPETLGCGIRVTGLGAADTTAGNGDFYISHPVVDQYDGLSIEVSGVGKKGHVRIIEPYAGAPAAATYIMRVRESGGAVSITGGDLYGTASTNQTVGINVENSTGLVTVDGTVLHEIGRPMTIINSQNVMATPRIVNHSNLSPTFQAAVVLTNVQRARIAPFVVGQANSFPQGVELVANGNSRVVVDPTGVDPAAITGGSANKLIVNSIQITAPGYYTPAGASGGTSIQATGIVA